MITYKETAARSIRLLFYSTKHYRPISPEHNKQIENVLDTNNLPRMNMMMFGAFKLLSQREKQTKETFESHDLKAIVNTIGSNGQKFQLQAKNLETYFDNMSVQQIVTPVKEITEFIEDDLIATDPKFLGDIYNATQRTDFEHKKVTNSVVNAKKPWMIIIALVAIVGAIGFMGFYLISNGGGENPLGGLLPSLPGNTPTTNTPNGKLTDQQVFAQYPTPEKLHNAIVKGDVTMNQLSPNMQKMANSYKPPIPAQ
jgi:hypothetical protein